jgi:hypothetical protein
MWLYLVVFGGVYMLLVFYLFERAGGLRAVAALDPHCALSSN